MSDRTAELPSANLEPFNRRPTALAQSGGELLVLAIVTTALTTWAYLVYPAWDDGFLLILAQSGKGHVIAASIADRPVAGEIWQFFSDRGLLVQSAVVLHWLTWFATGWITIRLWKLLLPQFARLAVPVACLALAPVLCRIQFVLMNPIVTGQIAPVLVYLAILLLFFDRGRTFAQQAVISVVAAAMVLLGSLFSEYSVPAVIVGAILIIGVDFGQSGGLTRRQGAAAFVLLAAGAIGYLVYHHLGNPNARPGVRPELSLVSEIG